MTPTEFTLWLQGYLEALEAEGIEKIKIKNIKEKMNEIKNRSNQERVVFGPNVNPQQQGYVPQSASRK
tara:strand:+ start:2482 stop:2685 length:204 start_codon:yes stop_codon:yes gene_type:complete